MRAQVEGARAVVMLSGGLDSTTVAAMAQALGFSVHALSFDYGQRHRGELEAAERVAHALGIADHRVVRVDLRALGGSALTSDALEVPKRGSGPGLPGADPDVIPITYVPARNTIFLSLALGFAETLGAFDLFFGANVLDYSGYPDCRPEYIEAFEQLANLATKDAISGRGRYKIWAPLIQMKKSEIIQKGIELGIDYAMTHSCYDPDGQLACGRCDACILRRRGFEEANVPDPTRYITS